ncbi:MAG: Gfo/Idh/MocA family oxidoreductase [Oscillospiraceae bacterium]|nr:Gfo/Idh/MocA family oxidoreductase [Oscillospiraceae bacterium]
MDSKIKIGVFGLRRGSAFIMAARDAGAEVSAVCDKSEDAFLAVKGNCPENIRWYRDFDEFICHPMDAAVLCNYYDEHAEYAIKALAAGVHVLTETACNVTLAEGAAICRAAEKSGKIFSLAENYPFMCANLELARLYRGGTLGRVLYAEGEYVHPCPREDYNNLSPGKYHWRNWIPVSYYVTHSLAPLMYMTGAVPKKVNALAMYAPELYEGTVRNNSDGAAIMLCTMDNGAIFRVTGCASFAGHGNWYRLACTKGAAETVRGNQNNVRLAYNRWNIPEGEQTEKIYAAQWPDNAELAEKAGHGGGDFWVMYHFINCVRENTQPFFDLYKSVALSSVGIVAWKSVLQGGIPLEIPDFADEKARAEYENDTFNPFPHFSEDKRVTPSAPAGTAARGITEADYEKARNDWRKLGYFGE